MLITKCFMSYFQSSSEKLDERMFLSDEMHFLSDKNKLGIPSKERN